MLFEDVFWNYFLRHFMYRLTTAARVRTISSANPSIGVISTIKSTGETLYIIANTNYNSIEGYEEYLYLSFMQSHAIEEYAKDIWDLKKI